MRYITDTDFLPEYRDLHFDSYQLLYGIAINQQEEQIYDIIITLCRKYREPILRKSKVDYWKTLVDKVISRLDYIDDKADVMVYLPYKQKLCTPERLIQRYSYARLVLENVRGLEMNQLIRRGNKSADDIKWFYPIKKLEDLMYDAVPSLAELHHKSETHIRQIITNELHRRGIQTLDANPSLEEENLYVKVFLNGRYLKELQPISESKEDCNPVYDNQTKLETIGFLYYALQFYFGKVQNLNKGNFDKLLEHAAIRIGNGIKTPDVKYDAGKCSKNTIYNYVHKKLFNNKNGTPTNFDTLEGIKEALENHQIAVPDELTQALGEHGKRKDKSKS